VCDRDIYPFVGIINPKNSSRYCFYVHILSVFLEPFMSNQGWEGRDGAVKYIPRPAEFGFHRAAPAAPPARQAITSTGAFSGEI
jgi:hypothetical protein